MRRIGTAGWSGTVRLHPGTNLIPLVAHDTAGGTTRQYLLYEFAPADSWLFAVGDSILVGVESRLEADWGKGTVDARVSRSMSAGLTVLAQKMRRNPRPEVVVVELGTNGGVTESHLERLIDLVSDTPSVYVVTINAPFSFVPEANARIAALAAEHDNVFLVDWHAVSANRPEWLRSDLVHPNNEGQRQFAALLLGAIGWEQRFMARIPRWRQVVSATIATLWISRSNVTLER